MEWLDIKRDLPVKDGIYIVKTMTTIDIGPHGPQNKYHILCTKYKDKKWECTNQTVIEWCNIPT